MQVCRIFCSYYLNMHEWLCGNIRMNFLCLSNTIVDDREAKRFSFHHHTAYGWPSFWATRTCTAATFHLVRLHTCICSHSTCNTIQLHWMALFYFDNIHVMMREYGLQCSMQHTPLLSTATYNQCATCVHIY